MKSDDHAVSRSLAVELDDLTVQYNGHTVIGGLDLAIAAGEFVAIVGRSGAGKTTLLKAIAGLVPSKGGVLVNGRLRMVFQENLLLPWLSVEQNIGLGLTPEIVAEFGKDAARTASQSTSKRVVRRRIVEDLLRDLGIAQLRNRYPNEISGGERQRVAMGRAFAPCPTIVCCDEPFGQLDVFTREKMQLWLLDFWTRHQAAILFTTHSLEEALIMADRVAVLEMGTVKGVHTVPFGRPRGHEMRYTPDFLELHNILRSQIGDGTDRPEASDG